MSTMAFGVQRPSRGFLLLLSSAHTALPLLLLVRPVTAAFPPFFLYEMVCLLPDCLVGDGDK